MASRKKQLIVTAIVMTLIIAAFGLTKFLQISNAIAQSKNFAPPPDAVTSAVVQQSTWQRNYEAIASLSPNQGTMLSAEQPGTVQKIGFESGAAVKAGDVLVELETSVETANLNAALARLEQAQKALVRSKNLKASNAVSASSLEAAEAESRAAAAEAESLKAMIAKKKILAPFSGRAGIREVNVGQFVPAGTAIVPLHSLDPMFVDFSLPQQTIANLAPGQKVEVRIEGMEQVFEASIAAINPQLDERTRNVKIRAVAANPGEVLRSGMFAHVKVMLPNTDTVIPIPATSVNYAPYGNSVYVIEKVKGPDGAEFQGVRQQIVKLGERRGDLVAVVDGLKPGEEIATSGVFKLRQGAPVVVNNTVTPGSNLSPQPADT